VNRIIAVGLIVAGIGVAGANEAASQELGQRGFVDRVYRDAAGEHKYVVFVPYARPPQSGWPVILFLHGAGERGTDGRRQLTVGLGPLVKKRNATFPAVVIFPQCENFDGPILQSWTASSEDARRALAILADVEADYPTNPAQRILTGWSMGAYGAWSLAAADPQHWSAVVPVSGGGDPQTAAHLKDVPIWAFHGADDSIVPASVSLRMVEAVRAAGGRVLYTEVPGDGHDIWLRVYDSDVVLDWMLARDVDGHELESIELPEADPTVIEATPFEPAMIVQRAMTLRLGEAAMDVIATGLPSSLTAERLTGELDDVTDRVELDGRSFDVRFGELTYSGELERVIVRPRGPDRLSGAFALRNVRLHIGRIVVSDGRVGFTAGPAEVVIGHRSPVWLRVEARPVIEGRRLALRLLRSSFAIPDSNWYVTEPQTIRVQGDWLTVEEVKTAVVGGIYSRRELVEEQVLSGVPDLLDTFAAEADLSPLQDMVAALWPLPVYSPHVRVWPESISTDAHGVSVTLSVAVASIGAPPPNGSPKDPQIVQTSTPMAYEIAPTSDLRVGLCVEVLDHISSLLAGTEAARIYASDIPEQPFVELMDPEAVSAALPRRASLDPDADVQTAFSLEAPLRIRPLSGQSGAASDLVEVRIEAPRLAMQVSVVEAAPREDAAPGGEDARFRTTSKPFSAAQSRPRATIFEGLLDLKQPISLQPTRIAPGQPGLRVVWEQNIEVEAVSDRQPADPSQAERAEVEAMAELFTRGWERWTAAQAEQVVALPEVSLGDASLMLQDLFWDQTRLTAGFVPPATRLMNATDAAVEYSVRGPYSRWSEVRSLEPGGDVSYETGTQLDVRPERYWDFEALTLPAGSNWELRSADDTYRFQWVRTDQ
jgi:predicted esterase